MRGCCSAAPLHCSWRCARGDSPWGEHTPGWGCRARSPPEDAAPSGAQGIACRAHVGVGCCGGAGASEVLGSGRAGEGSSRHSPTPRTCPRASPPLLPVDLPQAWGGVISTRPPTCNKSWPGTEGASCWTTRCGPRASCSGGGGTAALKGWIWAEPGGWCWGQKWEAEPEGLQGGSGRPSPWCATAGPGDAQWRITPLGGAGMGKTPEPPRGHREHPQPRVGTGDGCSIPARWPGRLPEALAGK